MTERLRDAQDNGAGPSRSSPPKKRKHSKRFNRSKTGCLSCRRRRIRCDELHPVCERCSESKTTCEWAASDPGSSRHSRGPNLTNGSSSAPLVAYPPLFDMSAFAQNVGSASETIEGIVERNGWANGIGGVGSSGWETGQAVAVQPAPPAIAATTVEAGGLYPWTTMFGQPGDLSQPDPHGAINLLDLFGIASTATSQVPSRVASRHTSPPPLPAHTTVSPATAVSSAPSSLSLSAQSTLAARRRAVVAFTTMPAIPPTIAEPIEHVFPSAGSKRLFQHVRSNTFTVIVALDSGGHQGKNPFMAMTTRIMLLDPTSNAQTAFRHSLLSLASAHIAQQHQRASPVQCRDMRVRTAKSKRKAMLHLYMDDEREVAGYIDLLLASCLTVFLRNKLCADSMWSQSIDMAVAHIMRCGGPLAVLSTPDQHPDRRFLVEQIAVADLFGTFTTGQEPRLLGEGAAWWNHGSVTWSETQWESFERFLGVSRSMTESIAKYRVIMSRNLQLSDEQWIQSKATVAAKERLVAQAEGMLGNLQQWSADQVNTPARKRIMNGDCTYRYMIVISLSIEVLGQDVSDPNVQAAVRSILELCSEMSREPANLVWPLLTAGACATAETDREWCHQLFDALGSDTCADIHTARTLLDEQRTRLDCGSKFSPWASLMKDMRLQVCMI